MKDLLYWAVTLISQIHDWFLHLNDNFELYLNDKQLHYIVIGALGLLLYFVTHGVFKRLSRWSLRAVSWIYTLTVMLVITFAIEIGQYVTGTGAMEFMDIAMGMWGVICFGLVYIGISAIIRGIKYLLGQNSAKKAAGLRDRDPQGPPQ